MPTPWVYSNPHYSNLDRYAILLSMKNPFRYGMRVCGCDFFDRTKVMRDIRNTLDGGNMACSTASTSASETSGGSPR